MIPEIRQLLEARPFVPFYIHTSGGNRYRVATPDHADFGPEGKRIHLWFDDQGSITLSGLHIVGVEEGAESPGQTV